MFAVQRYPEEVRCRCPACQAGIRFRTVFFALWPPRIRCPECGRRLVGDRFVRQQGKAVVGLAVVVGVVAAFYCLRAASTPGFLIRLLCSATLGAIAIGVPMTLQTLRRGSYGIDPKEAEPTDVP